jgi:hypothetical protein
MVGLALYAILAVTVVGAVGTLPVWVQTIIYLVLGIAWLLPLKNFMIWMETGRWRAPGDDEGTGP